MKYEILRTDKASEQLNEIIQYIAVDSGSVDVALTYLERLKQAIMLLRNSRIWAVIQDMPS